MATLPEKLAESLRVLKTLQDSGTTAIRSSQLPRMDRERLLKSGFIREVLRGWYISSRPDEESGESTAWYASFWSFCGEYLTKRFGAAWCLSAEQSLALHAGDWTVPQQLVLRSPAGGNKAIPMPFGTSVLDVRLDLPANGAIETRDGLRVYTLPAALVALTPTHFTAHPVVTRAALASTTSSTDLPRLLLDGGHSRAAGRLAGAFRSLGNARAADEILDAMRAAGFNVTESNPFEGLPPMAASRASAPVQRLRMLWQAMRVDVLEHFTVAPSPIDKAAYLRQVDGNYVSDAYNSLSIEGYRVNAELIERVRSGSWNPESIEADRNHRDALAARGYWQAFQRVRMSIVKVLDGANAGEVADKDHGPWYRELFAPSVGAGLIKASDLAGYRNGPVYIRRSRHVPASHESLRDLVPALFDLLSNEPEPSVRVVLGHFMFVYVHPYFDGNGRMGRFLMNLMMAGGGYPWTIVPLERRSDYMAALEKASVDQDIVPFTALLDELTVQASSA